MLNMDVQIYSVTGFDMKHKTVGQGPNNIGRIYLPKEWVGKSVAIILKELPDNRVRR